MTKVSSTLRAAFHDALEAYESWESDAPAPAILVDGRALSIGQICGLLWNCTQTMPTVYCGTLAHLLPAVENFRHAKEPYSRAARLLKWLYDRETVQDKIFA